MARKLTTEEWVKKAINKHGKKYDYSKVDYIGSGDKVKIICPEHGEFNQTASDHIKKNKINGCPECGKLTTGGKLSTNQWVEKSKIKHGGKYDYSKVAYNGYNVKVQIICPKHGEFTQLPNNHLFGQGCPDCATLNRGVNGRVSATSVVERSNIIHSNKYKYIKSTIKLQHSNMKIICPEHGEFEQTPSNHLSGKGCPKCASGGTSKAEQMIFELCKSYAPDVIQSDRTVIAPFELDIYIPSLKLAIEYNGTYWHSEKYKHKRYHQDKFMQCKSAGVRLFQIWEQDWDDPVKQDIILSMLTVKLGRAKRVFARKTICVEVEYGVVKSFYNENHLQGAGQCHSNQKHYVLFDKSNPTSILMAMSFDQRHNYITRVCTVKDVVVVGGASKLFKKLPTDVLITTYAANDLGGTLSHYENLKPKMTTTEPRYFWYRGSSCVSRETVQKHKLSKLYPDYDGSSEKVWMQSIGYVRVFDSGNTKLTFKT